MASVQAGCFGHVDAPREARSGLVASVLVGHVDAPRSEHPGRQDTGYLDAGLVMSARAS